MVQRPLPLKIALIGDISVGKTSLLLSFIKGQFPDEQMLSSLETLAKVVSVDSEKFNVTIVDSNGSSKHDRIRPLSFYYPNVDVFLMCYDTSNRASFESVSSRWIIEAHKHCPNAHTFIVGTKLDQKEKLLDKSISENEGLQLMNLLGAAGFMEISAKMGKNVDDLFVEAARIAKVKYEKKNGKKKK